jgi:crotonobetainyl-CoA:carnitine CoA-transferase CaiB-like acyl-CoA transferase
VRGAVREPLIRLLISADIWIETLGSAGLDDLGLAPNEIHALHPQLTMLSITESGRPVPTATGWPPTRRISRLAAS